MNIETANRLYQFRKKNHLSQEELAEKIGVSRQAISKWERAEASPDTDNLILLAQIYDVSLDDLLKDPEPEEEAQPEQPKASDDASQEKGKGEPKVSFKNGIHVHDDKDHVDISLSHGIHVHTEDGTKVDIGKEGIFVEENGEKKVFTDDDGHIHKSQDIIDEERKNKSGWMRFPYPVLAAIAYLCFGFFNVCGGWAFGWIIFLTIPIYYTTVEAIIKRNANIFCYPVLVVIAFLLLGFLLGAWHPAWVLFLTVPLYYWVVGCIRKED